MIEAITTLKRSTQNYRQNNFSQLQQMFYSQRLKSNVYVYKSRGCLGFTPSAAIMWFTQYNNQIRYCVMKKMLSLAWWLKLRMWFFYENIRVNGWTESRDEEFQKVLPKNLINKNKNMIILSRIVASFDEQMLGNGSNQT